MKSRILSLFVCLSFPAFAEENLFTVGVDTRCLYGLAPCWGKVREPISQVDGISWVSDVADSAAWTGQFKTLGGRLPDVGSIRELMHRFNGDQFTFRALEGTLNGKVEKRGADVFFKLDAGGEAKLEVLKKKVQWDVKGRKDFDISRAERAAFSKLSARATSASKAVNITGPLRMEASGWVMEVREFSWK